ncbi:MAG: hypothetical protein GEV06_18745 [Luteitalea sp.]|nr:hypothetical protein [Luteitalea sp.]
MSRGQDSYPWELPVGYGTPVTLDGARGTFTSGGKEYLITSRGNARTRWIEKADKAYVVSTY